MASKSTATVASKFAAKPTIVAQRAAKAKAKDVPVKGDAVNEDAMRRYAESIAQAQDELLSTAGVPSSTRLLCSAVAQFFTFAGVYYAGVQIVGVLTTAAIMFTGSSFIAFCVALLGCILLFKAAWHAGIAASNFILSFEFDDVASLGASVKDAAVHRVSLVRGWFKKTNTEVQYDNVGTC